jgi:HSP20 family protein
MPDTVIPVKKDDAKTAAPAPARRPVGTGLWNALHDEVDRMFDRFMQGTRLPTLQRQEAFGFSAPAVDVSEDDKAYRITAELPGMSEKDVDVSISHDTIVLKGEKRDEKEEKAKNYHVSERFYGSFQRSFGLPEGVDRDKIEAGFAKGVLTITLPKKPEVVKQQKKIEIKAH